MDRIKRVPKHLQVEGQKFWKSVLANYYLEDAHHLKLLEDASVCVDRIAQARRHLRKHGVFLKDRFGQLKENPAGKAERDNKVLLARLIRELNLDVEAPRENRPPSI